MVQIGGLVTYTVPAGKLFVLTGIGTSYGADTVSLRVNGLRAVTALLGQGTYASSIQAVPSGITVPAGSILDIANANGQLGPGYVGLGYLAPQ